MPGDAAPPAESALEELRRTIDRIDDKMLDLLVERTALVDRIAAAKRAGGQDAEGPYLRPGREMIILRRLLARHSGAFPKPVVVRMWREMFSALVALQGPLSVAVYMPNRGAGYLEMARDQYGAYTPMLPMQSAGPVVRAVSEGEVSVGVLPLPMLEDEHKWWPMLVSEVPGTPRVVSRLPVCGPGPGRGDGAEALAIARLAQEKTGYDRTLVVVETGSDISRAGLRAMIDAAGLPVQEITDSHDLRRDEGRLHLVEVADYVAPDDPRLGVLGADVQVTRTTVIGGYAVPFTSEHLAT